MRTAVLPPNEAERLAELQTFDILDTIPEPAYDAITFLAAQICGAPVAWISIIDANRQWFKSKVGFDLPEAPRDLSFCAHTILEPDAMTVVPDARLDERFSDHPFVQGDSAIRFYAGAPLVTDAGNALGTLCVIDHEPRQLTDNQLKSLEALSTQVMALLELRSTVRELEAKDEALREATKQRDEFMAMVSHEIRTPLTAVVGFVDLLRDRDSGLSEADRKDLLETVSSQAGDVEALIEDLMVASRAEAGSLTVANVAVGFPAQVLQVMEGLVLPDGKVKLDLEPARAAGDPARVRQIIRNLTTNALRYGGSDVTVRTFTSGQTCHLRVVDSGAGIPVEDRENVFAFFGRAKDVKEVEGSVGLGLFISRMLATEMGGTLTYDHVDGHSVFELVLPGHD
ncbi:MAG: GAF domain-containing sensor histidine kinase [Acidimicrobiia bacterium]|nr:GAF domain-containing sensor histidine kinase [Acidimicrobiia bacterium]